MFETVDLKIGSRHRDGTETRLDRSNLYQGPPIIDPPAEKQDFLAGDKLVVMYCDKGIKYPSDVQDKFRGNQVPGT